MEIDPETLSRRERYQLLLSIVVPRPIAFVTTISTRGVVNLAPFSFYGGVSSSPPVVMLSVARRGGARKDTAQNALETGELVIHASTTALIEAINGSSADYPAEVSEVEALGLETIPSSVVRPPRLAASPISLECVLLHAWEPEELNTSVLFARALRIHVRDDVLAADGTVDAERLDPLARLGGTGYARLGEVLHRERPAVVLPGAGRAGGAAR